MAKIKLSLFLLILGTLFYSRFSGLSWGFPYPMHPDERNMANAVQQLKCDGLSAANHQLNKLTTECFNPHFFAYGQFPLYLGYGVVGLMKFFDGDLGTPIGFQEAAFALRLISTLASILNVLVLYKTLHYFFPRKRCALHITSFALFSFSPYFIQFSHFGTTESLLMLFYSIIVYLCLLSLQAIPLKLSHLAHKDSNKYLFLLAFFSGLAIATKMSSLIFIILPVFAILIFNKTVKTKITSLIIFLLLTGIISIFFSPYNLISWPEFLSSMKYEYAVATDKIVVFYTKQFINTTPILFQFTKIFPYALGLPCFILSALGFVFLSWKNKAINFLRFSLLIYFIPNAFIFAKWTRFMAPIFPIMTVFAVLYIFSFKKNVIRFVMCILMIIPGLIYLSIYQKPDIRFTASDWIYKNIPAGSYVLSETANVVDIPLPTTSLSYTVPYLNLISFNFYDLDSNVNLQSQLNYHIDRADYIIVPSRRIFANHYCPKDNENEIRCKALNEKYPMLNEYYQKLFSGELGFEKVVEFSALPFSDEEAEETWSVFDHPVIRIYKKNK